MTSPSEYTSFVLSKEAPPSSFSEADIRLTHACLGLATELLELNQSTDRANTLEELGDFLWYLTLTANVLQLNLSALPPSYKFDPHSNSVTLRPLNVKTEEFLSLCKKLLIYRHEVLPDIKLSFTEVWEAFLRHSSACGHSLGYLIETNMEKLNKRYVSSFTQEEAEARVDKKQETLSDA